MPIHTLSLSYGKDSLACLGAIEKLGWPLDRIIHAEIWATDDIPADLPPMVEFKAKADAIIKERWGIAVEHVCAISRERERERETFQSVFYRSRRRGKVPGQIYGFPMVRGAWCNDRLKIAALDECRRANAQGLLLSDAEKNSIESSTIRYIGIAADEPERLARLQGTSKISPLAEIGWTEADCWKWCEENDLLSPIYSSAARGGCWFCHNQGVDQLRLLRKNYPDLWQLLLKWDSDSPVTFKANGRTVHDFDKRFAMEDAHLLIPGEFFRWKMVDEYIEPVPQKAG